MLELEPIQSKTHVVCRNKKKYDNFHHVHSRKGLGVLQSGVFLKIVVSFCIFVLFFFGFDV